MITSLSNPTVKELVGLRHRRERESSGRFVIEGRRPLAVAAQAGVELIEQVICPQLGGTPIPGVPIVEMAEAPFRKASIRQNPDGILAVAAHLDTALPSIVLPERPLVLVVEAIEKPGNLGAMLRTSDALGVDAVVVADPATDVHNPNVVRTSLGALFTVPLAVAAVPQVRAWLADAGVRLVATAPGDGRRPWEVALTGASALAIGAEDRGLSAEVRGWADDTVAIPLHGEVDSLNASVTAAVVLYEAVRQRRQG